MNKTALIAPMGLVAAAMSGFAYTATYTFADWFNMIIDFGGSILMGFITQAGTISAAIVGLFIITLALTVVGVATKGFSTVLGSMKGLLSGLSDI